jgi:hypothetical protein
VLLLDTAIFLTILGILLISFLFLRLMAFYGYPQERIEVFETMHFYTYLPIQVMFGFDLVGKIAGIIFGRKRQ